MSTQQSASCDLKVEGKIAELLMKADKAVQELHARTESIHSSEKLENLGFSRQHLKSLCDVLSRGTQVIETRIEELAGKGIYLPPNSVNKPDNEITEPITFLGSYRNCSRVLCSAMKEAMNLPDSTSAIILRELIMLLEKQLWMIDDPFRNRGVDDSRSVALFLSC
jgi:hypothetical protein